MFRCKMVEFFFYMFPLKIWQDFLIQRHIQKCPLCLKRLADEEEVRSLLLQENEVGDLWPAVKNRLSSVRGKGYSFLWGKWKLAFGAVSLVVVVLAGVWLHNISVQKKTTLRETNCFKIDYIKVWNKPAQAFIYQPKDSNMIFIWAEKIVKGEEI